jgi:hypothetical protein
LARTPNVVAMILSTVVSAISICTMLPHPLRRLSSIYMPATSAPGIHPRDLPEPLRSALIGPRARGRLERLLLIAGHPSITAAARALGLWHSASTTRSPCSNTPAAGSSSTAGCAPQAPRS